MKKRIPVCLFSVVTIIMLAVQVDAQVIRWGTYHENPGKIPEANLTDEYLKKFDAYYHGFANDEKVIYLTFDAGYEDGNTEKILDSLNERGIHAAFFLTGNYIESNPEITKRMVSEGHIVCNHTMTHPDTTKMSSSGFISELKKVESIYNEIIGSEMPKYYRPPECKFNEKNLKDTQNLGYQTVLWSIAYDDWQKKQPSHKEAFNKIIPNLHPGAIILLHSTSTTNAQIMTTLIDKILEKGYVFKSLDNSGSQGFLSGEGMRGA